MATAGIMIVEDEIVVSKSIQVTISKWGYEVVSVVTSGEKAVLSCLEYRPDLILMDISLKGEMDGIEAAAHIRSEVDIPVIFLTAYADDDKLERAKVIEPFGYLIKPFSDKELKVAMEMALYKAAVDKDRQRAEEALRLSEEKFRTSIDNMLDCFGMYSAIRDETGRIVDFRIDYVNEAACREDGVSRDEQIGRRLCAVHPGHRTAGLFEDYCRLVETGQSFTREALMYRDDPAGRPGGKAIDIRATRLGNGFASAWRDVSTRKQAEEALRESEERHRNFLEASPDPIVVFDMEGKALYCNQACIQTFGWLVADLIGHGLSYVPRENIPETRNAVSRMMQGEKISSFNTRRLTRDGRILDVEMSAAPIMDKEGRPSGNITILRDVTETRRLAHQLRQAQKMEALGTLAGGIAHDFNNILSAITGFSELAVLELPRDHPVQMHLNQVLKAGNRAKDLVRQVLTFSRQTEQDMKPIEIGPIVKETIKFLRATLPTTIEIRQNIEPGRGAVLADPTQIHQVVMNLCANAADAMRGSGGILELELASSKPDQKAAEKYAGLAPGTYHVLTVKDNGQGIERNVLERIFDPFFTTKGKGKGTGMGLSTVHGIVKSHGGMIQVTSEPGAGTTFQVFFPQLENDRVAREKAMTPLPTGRERILFVDDEEILADLGAQMLKRLGYQVVMRTGPLEALGAFRVRPEDFDLVITDMTMPNMTGEKLAGEIMKIRPDLPVILCTGFSESISEEKAKALGLAEFLMKPLAVDALAQTIRRVLDGK